MGSIEIEVIYLGERYFCLIDSRSFDLPVKQKKIFRVRIHGEDGVIHSVPLEEIEKVVHN